MQHVKLQTCLLLYDVSLFHILKGFPKLYHFDNKGNLFEFQMFNMRVPNSYIPWMSLHSCTYFFFLSLFSFSQNSAVLRDFLRLSGRNLHWNHPSHAAHPEQLQAHLAGQSCTSWWESCFLFVMVPASTLVCQSLKVMLSWMNFQNEQTLLGNRRKRGEKKAENENAQPTLAQFKTKRFEHLWTGSAIWDHLWPLGASLTNPRLPFHRIRW